MNKKYLKDINGSESTTTDENHGKISEIHTMYQELFLNDMKKDLESSQLKLTEVKMEQTSVSWEIITLKKEHSNLEATLNRYRNMVKEISETIPEA